MDQRNLEAVLFQLKQLKLDQDFVQRDMHANLQPRELRGCTYSTPWKISGELQMQVYSPAGAFCKIT